LNHGNALIFQRNFFRIRRSTVSPIRQKFALLISKENFADSESAWFQRLSASIDRFLKICDESAAVGLGRKKTVSDDEWPIWRPPGQGRQMPLC